MTGHHTIDRRQLLGGLAAAGAAGVVGWRMQDDDYQG